jgi:hypothetical protein
LEKASGPAKKLSDEQKARIAEIEKVYEAKIAELRLTYEARFRGAETGDELEKLQAELSEGLRSLDGRREREKEAIWSA